MSFGPTVPSRGPLDASIFCVGEAPGSEETREGVPFVGPSGQELRRMLALAEIDMDACRVANVFSRQPAGNNVALYGVTRAEASDPSKALGPLTANPITYASETAMAERERLLAEIAALRPNIVLALGNTACWALLGRLGIASLRGSVYAVEGLLPDRVLKVLPTYHPAAVLREWSLRVISIADFEKSALEATSPEHTPQRAQLWLQPTLADLAEFERLFLTPPPRILGNDVETRAGQITCMSFAPSNEVAICVPFWSATSEDGSYWPTLEDELAARRWCARWLEDETIVKVTQNGLYDVQYEWAEGYTPRGFTEDTMLAHHSLYCEMPKGLGFLGATYSRFGAWKHLRRKQAAEEVAATKRDD